jgi:Fe-S cluster assembly ATPase SufC
MPQGSEIGVILGPRGSGKSILDWKNKEEE